MFSSLSKPYVEAWYSVSEWGLLIFGLVLLVALAGELRADKEPKTIRRSKKELRMLEEFCQPKTADKPMAFFKKYKTAFALFVVFGVLGELFSEAGIFEFGRQLQIISDKENSDLQVSAARMQDEAWRSKMQVEKISNDIAQANERAAVANRNAIRARTDLAKAETQLNESVKALQDATSPMDVENVDSLGEELSAISGIGVEIRTSTDANAQHTADNLEGAFFIAKWSKLNRSFIGDIGVDGIAIGSSGDDNSTKAAKLLRKALTERNIPSVIFNPFLVRNVPTNSIIVAVMQRPDATNSQITIAHSKSEIDEDEIEEIRPEILKLQVQKFIIGSKEMADAQAEYNDLCSKYISLSQDESESINKFKALSDAQMEAEEGTNYNKPGIHLGDVAMFGPALGNFFSGPKPTNFVIEVHNMHMNPEILQ